MLLCYFTFHCLVDLILNDVLWYIAKDFLSLEQITESKNLATPALWDTSLCSLVEVDRFFIGAY
jgi:hypothetical protein